MIARAGSLVNLLLFVAATSAVADDLGRLFFSAAERHAFDAARAAPAQAAPPPSVSSEEAQLLPEGAPSAVLPPPLTVNGLVSRTRGADTAWVNGTRIEAGIEPIRPFDVNHSERLVRMRRGALELNDDPQRPPLRLKPGQTYDPQAARIYEAYDRMAPLPE
ncbi:MAG: hypothetical protein ACREXT_06695 [Gammaproteobacteria bacterium]